MLARLSIRDVVLIDQLDLEFSAGLTILTGETGAGKSILLDALSLALGARGDGGLVRHGQPQGQVTAVFELPPGHAAHALLEGQDIEIGDELILRRVQLADGRTRAYVNDQSVSAQALRALAAALVEIHGQHDERALTDSATHRALVDAYGGLEAEVRATQGAYAAMREAERALEAERARVAAAEAEADFARHAHDELTRLAVQPGRGRGTRRPPPGDDAGREGRRRHSRGARSPHRRLGDPADAALGVSADCSGGCRRRRS